MDVSVSYLASQLLVLLILQALLLAVALEQRLHTRSPSAGPS